MARGPRAGDRGRLERRCRRGLAVKFKDRPATTIPVTRARLRDHAVVYAAHFALYGALAATLHRVAGAESEVFLNWLTPAQLACMHASEGVGSRYDYVERERVALEVDGIGTIDAAGAYVSCNGALVDGAEPGSAPARARLTSIGVAHGASLHKCDEARAIEQYVGRLR